MNDVTPALQQAIIDACKKSADNSVANVQLPKGDYAVQSLEIPGNSKVLISSKDRARLLYVGKRNRPMFVLRENSVLFLKEKIEIYYNTNNVREAARLMIHFPPSGRVEISPHVKISLFSRKIE